MIRNFIQTLWFELIIVICVTQPAVATTAPTLTEPPIRAQVLLVHPDTTVGDPSIIINAVQQSLGGHCGTGPCAGAVDVIATPYESFIPPLAIAPVAVSFQCSGSGCVAQPNGTQSGPVIQAIQTAQTLARQYRVYIFLATVAEHRFINDPRIPGGQAYFNTLIIINSHGQIESLRREVTDGGRFTWESCQSLTGQSYLNCANALVAQASATVRTFSIQIGEPRAFRAAPILGYERDSTTVANSIRSNASSPVDALMLFEFGADTHYRDIELAISSDTWTVATGGWEWGVRDTFLDIFGAVISPHSQLVVVEKTLMEGAIIQLNTPPAPNLIPSTRNSTNTVVYLDSLQALRQPELGVVLMKVNTASTPIESATAQTVGAIQAICGLAHNCSPSVHLIVTPEFTYYTAANMDRYYVTLNCSNQGCAVQPTSAVESPRVVAALHQLQQAALFSGVEILVGTVAEKVPTSMPEFPFGFIAYNSLLRIDRNGILHRSRWKVADGESETCGLRSNNPGLYDRCVFTKTVFAAYSIHQQSLRVHNHHEISYLPIICSERARDIYLLAAEFLGISNADVLIGPEREGDMQYENIMNDVQAGTWNSTSWGWDWGIRDIFIANFVSGHPFIKPGGYLAVSDGGFGQAGVIRLSVPPTALPTPPISTPDFVFGRIPLS